MMKNQELPSSTMYEQETAVIYGGNKDIGIYGVTCVLNNMKAKGLTPLSIGVSIFYGEDRSKAYPIKNRILKATFDYPAYRIDVRVEQIPRCEKPWVQVYGTGVFEQKSPKEIACVKQGMSIVQTGFIGAEGTIRIMQEKKAQLFTRFTPAFLNPIKEWDKQLSAQEVIRVAKEGHAICTRHIGEQGVMQAIWNVAEEVGLGVSVDIKKVLIKQETIELCEQYRMNPYRVSSIGCILIIAEDAKRMQGLLRQEGVPSSIIGTFVGGNDKMVYNGDESSYIELQRESEMLKL